MIGVKYLQYYPEKVQQQLSRLANNNSWFKNGHGTRGVIGGTSEAFTKSLNLKT